MGAVPYYTSNDIISAVQRKIMLPLAQQTFSTTDILAFANEEMMISQVPSVLQFHEEYYVTTQDVPLSSYVSRYPIPNRAIGQRLRDLFWKDSSGNLFDMTRISQDDRAFFQRNIGANMSIHKYYFEGNEVVLTPQVVASPTGYLTFVYYLRPNQLVTNDQAANIQNFINTFTVNNASINAGDIIYVLGQTPSGASPSNPVNNTKGFYFQGSFIPYDQPNLAPFASSIPVTFTAVTGAPVNNLQFQIGATSTITASNLATAMTNAFPALNMVGTFTASANSTTVTVTFTVLPLVSTSNTILNYPAGASYTLPAACISTSNTTGFVVNTQTGIQFDLIPTNITTATLIDFLQTSGGHKIRAFSRPMYNISTANNTAYFNTLDIPYDLEVGDYICEEHSCIVPQLPDDLHIALVERTCARILAAIGDQQGLAASNAKLQEIEKRQGTLVDDRSEGNPQKITARHSLLRYFKMGHRRRV